MDRARLEEALIKAHRAGDFRAAQMFADILKGPKEPEREGFVGGLAKGAEQLVSGVSTGIQGLFQPEQGATQALAEQQRINTEYGKTYDLDALKQTYEQDGLLSAAGEALSQVPGAIGEQVPLMGSMLIGGKAGAVAGSVFGPAGTAIGGVIGSVAPAFFQLFSSNIARQKEETGQVDRAAAGATALVQSGLERVGLKVAVGKQLFSNLTGVPIKNLTEAAAKEQLTKIAQRGLLNTSGRAVARTATTEVPVEITQQALERLQAGLDVTSEDAYEEYATAGYAALLSSPVGTVGGISERSAARDALNPEQDTAAQQTDVARLRELLRQEKERESLKTQARAEKKAQKAAEKEANRQAKFATPVEEEDQALSPEVALEQPVEEQPVEEQPVEEPTIGQMSLPGMGAQELADQEEVVQPEGKRVLTRRDLEGAGIPKDSALARAINTLRFDQAKEAKIRGEAKSDRSLVGLDLNNPADIAEGTRIISVLEADGTLGDRTIENLKNLFKLEPNLAQRALDLEPRSAQERRQGRVEGIVEANKAYLEERAKQSAENDAGDGIPEPTKRAPKVTGTKLVQELFAQGRSEIPVTEPVTLADIAKAVEVDLTSKDISPQQAAGRANSLFGGKNKAKLEKLVGMTPQQIKEAGPDVIPKGTPFRNVIFEELTKGVQTEPAPEVAPPATPTAQGEQDATSADIPTDGERGTDGDSSPRGDVLGDDVRSGADQPPVGDAPTGTSVGSGGGDVGRDTGTESVQPDTLVEKPAAQWRKGENDVSSRTDYYVDPIEQTDVSIDYYKQKDESPNSKKPYVLSVERRGVSPDGKKTVRREKKRFATEQELDTFAARQKVLKDKEFGETPTTSRTRKPKSSTAPTPTEVKPTTVEAAPVEEVAETPAPEEVQTPTDVTPKPREVRVAAAVKTDPKVTNDFLLPYEADEEAGQIRIRKDAGGWQIESDSRRVGDVGFEASRMLVDQTFETRAAITKAVTQALKDAKVTTETYVEDGFTVDPATRTFTMQGEDGANYTIKPTGKKYVVQGKSLKRPVMTNGLAEAKRIAEEAATGTYNPEAEQGTVAQARARGEAKEAKIVEDEAVKKEIEAKLEKEAAEKAKQESEQKDKQKVPTPLVDAIKAARPTMALDSTLTQDIADSKFAAKVPFVNDVKGSYAQVYEKTKVDGKRIVSYPRSEPMEGIAAEAVDLAFPDTMPKSEQKLLIKEFEDTGIPNSEGTKVAVVRGTKNKIAIVVEGVTGKRSTVVSSTDQANNWLVGEFNADRLVIVRAAQEYQNSLKAKPKSETKLPSKKKPKTKEVAETTDDLQFEADKEILLENIAKLRDIGPKMSDVKALAKKGLDDGVLLESEYTNIIREMTSSKSAQDGLDRLERFAKDAKLTDDPDAFLYRTKGKSGSEGMSKPQIEQLVEGIREAHKAAPEIVIAETMDDLPPDTLRWMMRNNAMDAKGFYDTDSNKIYIIPENNVSMDDALVTMIHELVGHYGLRSVLGKAYAQTMKDAANNNVVKKQLGDREPTARNVEEAIAEISELYASDALPAPVRTVFAKIRDLFNRLLRTMGVSRAMSDQEFYNTLADSFKYTKEGVGKGIGKAQKPDSDATLARAKVLAEDAQYAPKRRPDDSLPANALRAYNNAKASEVGFLDIFRTNYMDNAAAAVSRIARQFGTALENELGKVSSLYLLRESQDNPRVTDAFLEYGGIGRTDSGAVTTFENDKGSMRRLLGDIADYAKRVNKTPEIVYGQVGSYLKALRNRDLINHNKEYEQKAKDALARGDKEGANNFRKQIVKIEKDWDMDFTQAEIEKFQDIPLFQNAANTVQEINKQLVNFRYDSGLLTKGEKEALLSNVNYVPFFREADEGSYNRTLVKMSSRGLAMSAKIPKLRGSETRDTNNVLDNMMSLIGYSVSTGLRNNTVDSMILDLETLGDAQKLRDKAQAEALERKGMPTVRYTRNGYDVYYAINDPYIAKAFANYQPPHFKNGMKLLHDTSRMFRSFVTLMPPFALKQVMMDMYRGYANSGVKNGFALMYLTSKNLLPAWKQIYQGKYTSKQFKDLFSTGVAGAFDFEIKNPGGDLKLRSGIQKPTTMQKIVEFAEALTRASDLSVRAAIYEQTLKENGENKDLATYRAREFINFKRRGAAPSLSYTIPLIPFFNAYLQGTDILIRNFSSVAGKTRETPTGLAQKEGRNQLRKNIAVLTMLGFAYALAIHDDEDYKQREWYERNGNFFFGDGLHVPVPPELGFLFKTLPEIFVSEYYNKGTDQERSILKAMKDTLPVMLDTYLLGGGNPAGVVPPLLKVPMELMFNKNTFTGRDVDPTAERSDLAAVERYGSSTAEVYKKVAEALQGVPGLEKISPYQMEHTVRGLFGGFGGIATMVGDYLLMGERGVAREAGKIPGLNLVIGSEVPNKNKTEFYDFRKKVMRVKNTYDTMLKRDPERAAQFLLKNMDLYNAAGYVQDKITLLGKLREEKDLVRNFADMSREERRQAISKIDELEVVLLDDVYQMMKAVGAN